MAVDSRDAERNRLVREDDEPVKQSSRVPRATVRPAFDLESYAGSVTTRERQSTILDEEATEQARLASVLMDSTPPDGVPQATVEVFGAVSPATDDLVPIMIEPAYGDDEVAFYRARLAPMTRAPRLVRAITELGSFIEDPKTAFVLGFVDGFLPLDTIVEVAGLPEVETLRILDRAVGKYVITFQADDG